MPNYEKLSPEITERIKTDIENGTRPDFAAKSSLAKSGSITVSRGSANASSILQATAITLPKGVFDVSIKNASDKNEQV